MERTSIQTLHPAQSKLSLPRPLCSAPPSPDPPLRYTKSDSIALVLIPSLVVEYHDGSDSYTAIRFPFLETKRFSSHISWKLPGNMSPVTDFTFVSFQLGFWCWERMISMDRSACQLPCDYTRFRFQKRCRMFATTICTKSMKPIDKDPKCPPRNPTTMETWEKNLILICFWLTVFGFRYMSQGPRWKSSTVFYRIWTNDLGLYRLHITWEVYFPGFNTFSIQPGQNLAQ